MNGRWITMSQAARENGCSMAKIRTRIKNGKIHSYRSFVDMRKVLVNGDDVAACFTEHMEEENHEQLSTES